MPGQQGLMRVYGPLMFGSCAPLFSPTLPSLPAPSFSCPLGGAPSLRSGFLQCSTRICFLEFWLEVGQWGARCWGELEGRLSQSLVKKPRNHAYSFCLQGLPSGPFLFLCSVALFEGYFLCFEVGHALWRASLVAQTVKRLPTMWETWVQSLGQEDLEQEMVTHSSTLAWKITWMKEPGRLQSMGLQRVRHDWATSLSMLCGRTTGPGLLITDSFSLLLHSSQFIVR